MLNPVYSVKCNFHIDLLSLASQVTNVCQTSPTTEELAS